MTTAREARILALQHNIRRYSRLLATELTDLERAFIHRRLAEERLAIEALEREAVAEERAVAAHGSPESA